MYGLHERNTRSLDRLVRNRVEEDSFVSLVKVVAGCGELIHVTAPFRSPNRLGLGISHARRNIYEVYQSTPSPLAKEALERIAELFPLATRPNRRAPPER